MSEFCVRCCEFESKLELLTQQNYSMKQQIEDLQAANAKLQRQNEALILDVAFYGGNLINLSCDKK